MTCIKLSPIGNCFTAGNTRAVSLKIAPTDKGRVVVAQDAIKFPKEALNARVDHAFDTPERATQTIKMLLPLADRLIPGHFMEMYRENGSFTWDDTIEFPIIIR